MRGPRPKGGAALVKSHDFCQARLECKIDERRRSVPPQPHLREGRPERRKELSREIFPTSPRGVLSLGVVCPETDAPHGVKRAGSVNILVPVLDRCCFMTGFSVNLEKVPARTASSRTRSQIAQLKFCTPRQRRPCSRGFGEAIIRSAMSCS